MTHGALHQGLILWHKVLIGLVAGIVVGLVSKEYAPFLIDYLKPIGKVFVNLLKMIVLPVLFFSIISGITNSNTASVGRLGKIAALLFIMTSSFAVFIGLATASILKPGVGSSMIHLLDGAVVAQKIVSPSVIDFIVNIVPKNIVQSFAEDKVLQVVFFSFITGFTLNKMGGLIINPPIRNEITPCREFSGRVSRWLGKVRRSEARREPAKLPRCCGQSQDRSPNTTEAFPSGQ